jgi:hypothetical protein
MFTFGLRPPEEKHPKYWWGARAIFERRVVENRNMRKKSDSKYLIEVSVSLLYDRQSYAGENPKGDGEGDKKFTNWIDNVGLPAVRKWADGVATDGSDKFNFEDKEYHIIATPNQSHGYMYIGAWSIEEKEVQSA